MPASEAPATAVRRVALIGHRNVGKSTLFGALTGLRQKTANYPGVTVERRSGVARGPAGTSIEVLDLPGLNSLVPRSPDEEVVANALLGDTPPEVVVLVADANQLRRGLLLLSQILDCGVPTILCLNMADEARSEGRDPDPDGLSKALGVPVITTSATKREGFDALLTAIEEIPAASAPNLAVEFDHVKGLPGPSGLRWRVLRDAGVQEQLARQELDTRWAWVDRVLEKAGDSKAEAARQRSDSIDRWLLHPLLGPAVFLVIMGSLFQAVFSLATPLVDGVDGAFGALGELLAGGLPEGILREFLVDGLVAGVGGVLVFLPQILILFALLGLLEDSGYLMRAAFLIDAPLRKVGLSGRSFVPLLSSFACAIPGIMAARTIEERRERNLAIAVAPLLTCSARLPVYTILIATFIPADSALVIFDLQGLTMLGLYLLGGLLAALSAWVINRFQTGPRSPMVLELPPYRAPRLPAMARRLWDRCWAFVKNAGTVILAMSIVVWALLTFPKAGPDVPPAQAVAESYGGQLGHLVEPAIEPLGFDWRIGIGLVGSLAAREVFVSTMSVVYAVEDEEDEVRIRDAMVAARHDGTSQPVYDLPTVLALLVFFAVSLQCISTIGVVVKETRSWRFAGLQFVAFTALAWVLAFATRLLAAAF